MHHEPRSPSFVQKSCLEPPMKVFVGIAAVASALSLRSPANVALGAELAEAIGGLTSQAGSPSYAATVEQLRDSTGRGAPPAAAGLNAAMAQYERAAGSHIPTDQDFAAPCPDGWEHVGNQCEAPARYRGPCEALQSFASQGLEQRAELARE